jgi:hypothetical protein
VVFSRQVDLSGEIPLPSSLQPGVYILEVDTENTVYRGRFIKE